MTAQHRVFNRAAVIVLLAMSSVLAQEATPTSAPSDSLSDRQAVIRDRVSRLEDRMFQLSQALKKSEPDKAAKLIESLGATRGRLVRRRMEELVEKLRGEKYADAADEQDAVTRDLQFILKMMLEEPERLEDRKEEIERLGALRERLDKLVERQRTEKLHAESSAATREQAQALADAASKLKGLLDRQRGLADKIAQGDLARKSADQTDIRAETQALENQLRSLKDSPAAERAAGELKNAAAHMSAATENMESGDAAETAAEEKLAVEKLESALKELEQQAAEKDRAPPLDKQSEAQSDTARQTQKLAEDMQTGDKNDAGGPKDKKNGRQQPGGDKKPSKPSEDEQAESPPSPGQEDIQGAVPLQEDAADKLQKKKPADAAKRQDQALKKLESARQQLTQSLEQLRKEQQEELLAALEARVRAMLAQQVECTKSTKRLAAIGPPNWKRTDQLELGEISTKQRGVGDEADKALYILREEGTTVVFPKILEQVRDDARDVAGRLAAADTGHSVLLTQEMIEQTLRELLDAVKQQQDENQSGKDSGGGGDDADRNPPLLPGSAELKLLRSCQLRVNLATQAMEKDRAAEKPDDLRKRLKKLTDRQQQVSEMAKSMHESMTKAQ